MEYYVSAKGEYIGGFEGVTPPIGSLKVSAPPADGRQLWNGSTWVWPRDQLTTEALVKIATWRSRQEATEVTFEYAGRTWDAGLRSQTRIEPVLNLPTLPGGFFWTDHDNNDVPVTMTQLREIGEAMNVAIVTRGFAIHARQRQMKEQIETLTAEELLAFEPGWPNEQD